MMFLQILHAEVIYFFDRLDPSALADALASSKGELFCEILNSITFVPWLSRLMLTSGPSDAYNHAHGNAAEKGAW